MTIGMALPLTPWVLAVLYPTLTGPSITAFSTTTTLFGVSQNRGRRRDTAGPLRLPPPRPAYLCPSSFLGMVQATTPSNSDAGNVLGGDHDDLVFDELVDALAEDFLLEEAKESAERKVKSRDSDSGSLAPNLAHVDEDDDENFVVDEDFLLDNEDFMADILSEIAANDANDEKAAGKSSLVQTNDLSELLGEDGDEAEEDESLVETMEYDYENEEEDDDRQEAASTGEDSIVQQQEIAEYIGLLTETPVGLLDIDETLLLRESLVEIMKSLAAGPPSKEAAETAEMMLFRGVDEWRAAGNANYGDGIVAQLAPTSDDFLRAMTCWASLVDPNPARRNTDVLPIVVRSVWHLFNQQQKLSAELESATPSPETYEVVLKVLSSSREKGADRKVFSVFESATEKSLGMYEAVISSLAKSRDRGAAQRAEEVLKEGVKAFPPVLKNGKPSGIRIETFNFVLTAWAKSGLPYGPERAEKLIVFMDETDTENGNLGLIKPNIYSFTSLIDAYAQMDDWHKTSESEQLLNRILDQYLNGEGIMEPSVASWNIVISSWARLARKGSKGAAARAERLLRRMEDLHADGKIGFGPDEIVYITVMNAFANSKAKEGPAKAEEILDLMNEMYLDGDEAMKPSIRSIKTVLDSWVKSNSTDSMDEAEILLERYEEELDMGGPETADEVADIYRTMLFGWAKKGNPKRAQEYLSLMIKKDMKPDCFCYEKIIEANTLLGDNKAFERSYAIFQLMEERRKLDEVEPNERVYTSFIRAMTKARVEGLPLKANLLLERMKDLYDEGNQGIQPTRFTLNAVLRACAETPETPDCQTLEALKIAVRVFNDLRNGIEQPDHVSFGNMLQCSALVPAAQQREALVQSTFDLCCDAGLVNNFVIRDLQQATTEELWRSLLDCPVGECNIYSLPPEWSRRVGMRKRDSYTT